MSKFIRFALMMCFILVSFRAAPLLAQAGGNGNANGNNGDQQQPHAYTPGQLQDEVNQLARDLDDPNYDYSLAPARIRQIFQDFGQLRQTMDPDEFRQFAQQLMTQFRPVMQRNQAKLQMAFQYDYIKGLQEPLGCSDDEFAALRPSLLKVVQAEQNVQTARAGGFGGGPGGPGGGQNRNPNQALTPIQQALSDLQTALDDQSSTQDSINSKVDALRLAKDKAEQDLKNAREELRTLLTIRQEAYLVTEGLLD
jgi:hypothetical protein